MTIITLKCDDRSNKRLRDYLKRNGIQGKDEFHTTLLHSEARPCYDRLEIRGLIESQLPLHLNQNKYFFGIFNPNILVLCYDSDMVRWMRAILNIEQSEQYREGPRSEKGIEILLSHHPWRESPVFGNEYLHISLARGYAGRLEKLSMFKGQITFSELNWYHQEHL